MVKAGGPVDAVIEELKPFLQDGDIVIDGGNFAVHGYGKARGGAGGDGDQILRHGRQRRRAKARCVGPSIMPGGDM